MVLRVVEANAITSSVLLSLTQSTLNDATQSCRIAIGDADVHLQLISRCGVCCDLIVVTATADVQV